MVDGGGVGPGGGFEGIEVGVPVVGHDDIIVEIMEEHDVVACGTGDSAISVLKWMDTGDEVVHLSREFEDVEEGVFVFDLYTEEFVIDAQ